MSLFGPAVIPGIGHGGPTKFTALPDRISTGLLLSTPSRYGEKSIILDNLDSMTRCTAVDDVRSKPTMINLDSGSSLLSGSSSLLLTIPDSVTVDDFNIRSQWNRPGCLGDLNMFKTIPKCPLEPQKKYSSPMDPTFGDENISVSKVRREIGTESARRKRICLSRNKSKCPLIIIPSICLSPNLTTSNPLENNRIKAESPMVGKTNVATAIVNGNAGKRISSPKTKLNDNHLVRKLERKKPVHKKSDHIRASKAILCPGDLEGVAMKGWPLLFHNIHSDNIQISLDRRRAKRFESFCKGICFSNRPVAQNERVYLKFAEVSTSWSGVVRFGLMSHDPATINGSELPRYACPDLTNKPGYWAKAVPERFAEQSNTLFFYYNRNGDVMFGLNNEDKGLFFSGVNTSGPLWALVDIYGNSTSMEFIDGRQMNNLSPSSGVPPTSDISVSPELMQAYASMRLQQPSPGLSPSGHSQSMPSLPAAPGFSSTGPPVRFYNTVSFAPLPFHAKCGRNVCFSSDKIIAVRLLEDYCNGYVFTQRPLRPGERLVIQILSVDTAFVGGLAFGMTACDPKHLNTEELPDDSDLLLDRPEYWVVNKDVCSAPEVGDELSFHLTDDGEVRYGKNGHHVATLMHVDKTLPLWVFFDVYGSTQKIKSLGIVSGLLPVSSQHRASISSGGGLTVALPPPRQSNSPSSSSSSSSHLPTSGSSNITPPPRPPPPRNSPSSRQPPSLRSESPTPPSLPPKPFRPLPAPPPAPGTILQPTQVLSAVPPASQLSPPPVTPRTQPHCSGHSLATTTTYAQCSPSSMAKMTEMMGEHESQEAADNASNECSVCFEKAVDCVLYTCGHMCLCYECAIDIKDNQGALCPICRQAIKDIIKIYRS